jgi:hypothetical protein
MLSQREINANTQFSADRFDTALRDLSHPHSFRHPQILSPRVNFHTIEFFS